MFFHYKYLTDNTIIIKKMTAMPSQGGVQDSLISPKTPSPQYN